MILCKCGKPGVHKIHRDMPDDVVTDEQYELWFSTPTMRCNDCITFCCERLATIEIVFSDGESKLYCEPCS